MKCTKERKSSTIECKCLSTYVQQRNFRGTNGNMIGKYLLQQSEPVPSINTMNTQDTFKSFTNALLVHNKLKFDEIKTDYKS